MEFICAVCNTKRDNDDISVLVRKGDIDEIEISQNIKYCNDSKECINGAKDINLLKHSGWKPKEK